MLVSLKIINPLQRQKTNPSVFSNFVSSLISNNVMKPLQKNYVFTSFEEAMQFIAHISPIFTRENHHPEIKNFFNRVELGYYTTSAGNNVTALDRSIAKEVDMIYKTRFSTP